MAADGGLIGTYRVGRAVAVLSGAVDICSGDAVVSLSGIAASIEPL
jgi:hypothetical protein